MSQTNLSHEIGISYQQVQKYESGTNRVSAGRLQQLADILQVPVTFFYDGAPTQHSKSGKPAAALTYVTEFLESPDGLILARAFTRIGNAKLRRIFVRLVEDISAGT